MKTPCGCRPPELPQKSLRRLLNEALHLLRVARPSVIHRQIPAGELRRLRLPDGLRCGRLDQVIILAQPCETAVPGPNRRNASPRSPNISGMRSSQGRGGAFSMPPPVPIHGLLRFFHKGRILVGEALRKRARGGASAGMASRLRRERRLPKRQANPAVIDRKNQTFLWYSSLMAADEREAQVARRSPVEAQPASLPLEFYNARPVKQRPVISASSSPSGTMPLPPS